MNEEDPARQGAAPTLRSLLAFEDADAVRLVCAPASPSDDAEALRGPETAPSLAVLAARVAAYVKGSITIEDTRPRVLAHSATGPGADPLRRTVILGGRVPDWRVAELRRSGLRTLAAYLYAGGDVPEAARRLVVHANTLRYRLGRVRERYGVDLDDPDTRLLLTLAVRLVPPTRH